MRGNSSETFLLNHVQLYHIKRPRQFVCSVMTLPSSARECTTSSMIRNISSSSLYNRNFCIWSFTSLSGSPSFRVLISKLFKTGSPPMDSRKQKSTPYHAPHRYILFPSPSTLEPSQGKVTIDSQDMISMGVRDVTRIMGYVPQASLDDLAYHRTCSR